MAKTKKEKLEEELKKIEEQEQERKREVREFKNELLTSYKTIESRAEIVITKCETAMNNLNLEFRNLSRLHETQMKKLNDRFREISNKVESWEESLYFIMHNIRKNQFLYAHYPEEWVKSYLDLKDQIKYENENIKDC